MVSTVALVALVATVLTCNPHLSVNLLRRLTACRRDGRLGFVGYGHLLEGFGVLDFRRRVCCHHLLGHGPLGGNHVDLKFDLCHELVDLGLAEPRAQQRLRKKFVHLFRAEALALDRRHVRACEHLLLPHGLLRRGPPLGGGDEGDLLRRLHLRRSQSRLGDGVHLGFDLGDVRVHLGLAPARARIEVYLPRRRPHLECRRSALRAPVAAKAKVAERGEEYALGRRSLLALRVQRVDAAG
mmetsp:Transcript_92340/g.263769  ORF Transcript_92340/g.263769 Transcript_92340/m.263769 type:complete len:240 (+) Transcript_92340:32-751(+)